MSSQAFSIAGLRNGLDDARGQLTLSYVELANAIDAKRHECGEPESIMKSKAMRRNMQEVLERWRRWAASEEYCSLVNWPAISVILRCKSETGKPVCSDEDGLTIDTCVACMSTVRPSEDILILGLRFIGGRTTRFIAEVMGIPRFSITRSLRASEEFLEGYLVAMAIRLDMDLEVAMPEKLADVQKSMLYDNI